MAQQVFFEQHFQRAANQRARDLEGPGQGLFGHRVTGHQAAFLGVLEDAPGQFQVIGARFFSAVVLKRVFSL